MKRYLLFAGYDYYPAGGWGDFIEAFPTFEEAAVGRATYEKKRDWIHIVDLARLEQVYEASWAPDWPRE